MSEQDDDPTLTAEDMFGPPTPDQAVHTTLKDRAPYRTAPRFRYRSDGRPLPMDEPREDVETELPLDYCSDGTSFRRRRD